MQNNLELQILGKDIWSNIFLFLDDKNLFAIFLVCKDFNEWTKRKSFWYLRYRGLLSKEQVEKQKNVLEIIRKAYRENRKLGKLPTFSIFYDEKKGDFWTRDTICMHLTDECILIPLIENVEEIENVDTVLTDKSISIPLINDIKQIDTYSNFPNIEPQSIRDISISSLVNIDEVKKYSRRQTVGIIMIHGKICSEIKIPDFVTSSVLSFTENYLFYCTRSNQVFCIYAIPTKKSLVKKMFRLKIEKEKIVIFSTTPNYFFLQVKTRSLLSIYRFEFSSFIEEKEISSFDKGEKEISSFDKDFECYEKKIFEYRGAFPKQQDYEELNLVQFTDNYFWFKTETSSFFGFFNQDNLKNSFKEIGNLENGESPILLERFGKPFLLFEGKIIDPVSLESKDKTRDHYAFNFRHHTFFDKFGNLIARDSEHNLCYYPFTEKMEDMKTKPIIICKDQCGVTTVLPQFNPLYHRFFSARENSKLCLLDKKSLSPGKKLFRLNTGEDEFLFYPNKNSIYAIGYDGIIYFVDFPFV